MGADDDDGWRGRWHDVPMFFAGWSPSTTLDLLAQAGLIVDEEATIDLEEPEGPVRFLWVLAHRG